MSDKQTITIMVAGSLAVTDITKSTTCDDVIRTLINEKVVTNDNMEIVQRVGGVERRVSGKTKIQKFVRSTGATKSNSLTVRKVEVNKSERHVFRQLKSKVERVKSKFSKSRDVSTLHENMTYGSTTDKTNVYSKVLPVEMLQDPTMSKLTMMKRYMDDVMTYSPGPSGRRSRGDGASFCSRLEDLVSVRGDIKTLDDTCVDDLGTHANMNEAFLNESMDDTVTEFINTDLNVCMINEDSFSETESAFGDDSDINNVNELDRNVFTDSLECNEESLERIRKLFGSGEIPETSMDSVLDSFMKTLIQQTHQSDDEGVSSMGSDLL